MRNDSGEAGPSNYPADPMIAAEKHGLARRLGRVFLRDDSKNSGFSGSSGSIFNAMRRKYHNILNGYSTRKQKDRRSGSTRSTTGTRAVMGDVPPVAITLPNTAPFSQYRSVGLVDLVDHIFNAMRSEYKRWYFRQRSV